jgi:Icc-related predicted phosphoesterase
MKILHSSDLHGQYDDLFSFTDFDLWIDTGDFFPNSTRGERKKEIVYQQRWAIDNDLGSRLTEWLNGRPLVSVGGNHDYVALADLIDTFGGKAFDLSEGSTEIAGMTFAGFREIPWIIGEWNGETHDLSGLVRNAIGADPDILVTHAPPAGILDTRQYRGGIEGLAMALNYQPHRVKYHFFGHIHENGGKVVDEMGIKFINGANHIRVWGI